MARRNDAATRQKHHATDAHSPRLGRRSFLRRTVAVAGAAAAAPAVGGIAAAATERRGMAFERVVDVVDDCGADASGKEPADGAIAEAIAPGTLVRFPAGTYKITKGHTLPSGATVGFVGDGDVSLEVAPDTSFHFLDTRTAGDAPEQVLFEGIDIDVSADNGVTGMRLNTQRGMHVQDVEYVGRGTHNVGEVPNALTATISDAQATGIVKRLVAKKGSAWARYKSGNGRVGIGVYRPNRGTLKVIDCHLEEFGNNGMYAGRHPGNVQVEGGTFRNNNVAQVRISGKGSYVDGATIEVDPGKYTGPREDKYEADAFNMRGVWIEGKRNGGKPMGVEVRACEAVIRDNPAPDSAIRVHKTGKGVRVSDTHIVFEPDGVPPIAGRNTHTRNVDVLTP